MLSLQSGLQACKGHGCPPELLHWRPFVAASWDCQTQSLGLTFITRPLDQEARGWLPCCVL